jgi:endonuclease/exonuclease/phosphatase family metal-dependent hydrolase
MQNSTQRWARGIGFIVVAGAALLAGAGCGQLQELDAEEVRTAGGAVQGGPAGLSILAWNMESFPLSASTPGHIKDAIEQMQPDVVGVEEIRDEEEFLAMAGTLGGYAAVLADDPGGAIRVGMLYRQDRVSVSEVETLFTGNHYAFPRPPLKVHVTVQDADFDFDFVAIHLKAMMDAGSKARRQAACAALDAWVQDRVASGFDPDIVLAGDFNDKFSHQQSHSVFDVFLDAPERYRFLTREVADAGDFSYIPYNSLIDHVLVTTPVLQFYGSGDTDAVHLEDTIPNYQHAVSDHRPIRVRFAGQ